MIRINLKDVQRGDQVAMWMIADKLDRRYAQHVRQLARELNLPTARRSKRDLIDDIAATLAGGHYPQVIIKWNLG